MKKIYVIICLLGLTLSALLNQACNSDLLDTVNPNKLTTKEFWRTEKDAQIKKILTDEQYNQYLERQKKADSPRKKGHGRK